MCGGARARLESRACSPVRSASSSSVSSNLSSSPTRSKPASTRRASATRAAPTCAVGSGRCRARKALQATAPAGWGRPEPLRPLHALRASRGPVLMSTQQPAGRPGTSRRRTPRRGGGGGRAPASNASKIARLARPSSVACGARAPTCSAKVAWYGVSRIEVCRLRGAHCADTRTAFRGVRASWPARSVTRARRSVGGAVRLASSAPRV